MQSQNKELQGEGFDSLDSELINKYNSFRTSPNKEYICFAPFTSLFFKPGGHVFACCENLTYKYAVYPEQSIHDIWFGEKIQKLREHIRYNDLNSGCDSCKHNIEIENFRGVKARFYDSRTNPEGYPVRMEFQLSNTCNLRCIMCDGWSSSLIHQKEGYIRPVANPYMNQFVKELEEFIPRLNQAFFVGGEPFMIGIYYEIWEKIVELNPSCMISIQSNGTILNDKVKSILEQGNFEINISLDSVRKEKYEKIRKNATFEKTMQNIDYFVEYCKRKNTVFQLTSCPMQNNWKEVPGLIRFANSKEVRILFHTVLYPGKFTLFGFNYLRLKRLNQYLGKALLSLPEETDNERFNLQSLQTLMYQISNLYIDMAEKKKWRAFEKEQKMNLKRDYLNRIERLEQSKRISIEKRKYEIKKAIDKNYLIRFFRREVNHFCIKKYFYQPVKLYKLLKIINLKLDEIFTLHSETELAVDIVVTIYSQLSLSSMIKSLEHDTVEKLIEGYQSIKKMKMTGTHNDGLQSHGIHPLDKELISDYNFVRTSPNKEYLCFAPFTSLFFDVTGDVYACCENAVYKYATYPDQSVHDIWFGEKIQKLREHIKNNDLNLGCNLCKYNIETKNFSGVKARFYDYAKSTGEFPVRMEFQLSNTCNLECAMCDGWSSSLILKNKYKLPPFSNPYDDHFVGQLVEFIPHLKQAFFVGGEPFMIELYYKIWEKIVELNPSCIISVQTNGTILNQKVKALLEKGNFEINISLDSVRKEKYEIIRKNGIFEKTMQNIDYFVEYCKRKNTVFQFTSCPMQNNWKEIPELIRFANEKDVRIMFHTVLYPHNFTLFGYHDNKLKLVNNYLAEASLKLPEETGTEKFNRQSLLTLIYQINHFYNNNKLKKEWFAFELGQKKFYKRKQSENLEKLEQRKNIAIEKEKSELHYAGDKNYLIRYFRREVNMYCIKRYYYQPLRLYKLKKVINKKLDDFFAMYPEQDMAVDIVVTVFSHIPLNSIIQSLKNDTVDKLIQGYHAIKKSEEDDGKSK